jgi:hypothetical protein
MTCNVSGSVTNDYLTTCLAADTSNPDSFFADYLTHACDIGFVALKIHADPEAPLEVGWHLDCHMKA